VEVVMATHSITVNHIEQRSWLKEILIILGASVIMALSGPVSIRLPFTPVPIVTQNHVILLLAVLLGSKRGALAVMAYLLQGAIGLPVFAGGKCGFWHLLGPTGGYLFSYVFAAYGTGYLMEKVFKRTPVQAFFAMGIGSLIIYLIGVPWLSLYCGWGKAFQLGMLPFLVGDLLKLVIAGQILKHVKYFNKQTI
jgi:biotin transport system substrate-specific component